MTNDENIGSLNNAIEFGRVRGPLKSCSKIDLALGTDDLMTRPLCDVHELDG